MGYFTGNRFFRVVTQPKPFVVQWGIPGDPKLAQEWWNKTIPDEPVKQSNTEGILTFAAGTAANSRATQVFINLGGNKFLDNYGNGFPPIGKVVEGMDVVRKFNAQYQDKPCDFQEAMVKNGNEWLDKQFPGLDYVKSATIVE
jgi:peptidyl-prolyl cis-trans isomerase A (cyclophilin A)